MTPHPESAEPPGPNEARTDDGDGILFSIILQDQLSGNGPVAEIGEEAAKESPHGLED